MEDEMSPGDQGVDPARHGLRASSTQPGDPAAHGLPSTSPPAGNVQYVVQGKSLIGVGGWLAFFMVLFGLAGLGWLITFFVALAAAVGGATGSHITTAGVITLICSLPIAVACVLTVVLIAKQKLSGKWLAIGTYGAVALYATIVVVVGVTTDSTGTTGSRVVWIIAGIVISWVVAGLYSLYFLMSKRVKATLVK